MRGLRFLFVRVAITTAMLAPAACSSILGIDPGQPRADSADAADGSDDVTTGSSDVSVDTMVDDVPARDAADGGFALDASDATVDAVADAQSDASIVADAREDAPSEAGDGGDAGVPDAGVDACTSDPNWCTSHCGTGPDNCGVSRQCVNNCPVGWLCESTTNTCQCQADPSWCTGRCGTPNNNCGTPVGCGVCPNGASCNANTCGCVPAPNPCGTMQCGQTTDSCGHPVTCGLNGMCANGGVCNATAGTCCTPNSNPCAGRCGVTVDNGCGQRIACPTACAPGNTCDSQGYCQCLPSPCGSACGTISNGCGGTMTCGCGAGAICTSSGQCCVPNPGCSPTCMDNCGQPTTCCQADSGPPPDAGGTCGPDGASCGKAACCSGYCGQGSICVSFCSASGSPCMSTQQCCVGLSCFSGIAAAAASSGGAIPPPMGYCQ